MKEHFQNLMDRDVKPFFKQHGYSAKGLDFHYEADTLVYKFNFQEAKANTVSLFSFYVNCSIHSTELAELQSALPDGSLLENKSHLTCRIREIAPSAPDLYSFTKTADPDLLSQELVSHLEQGRAYLHTLTDARAIVDYYMAKTALHLSEETFRFLLQTGDVETARQYWHQLYAKYGAQKRWAIFETKYAAIWAEYGRQRSL